MDVWVVPMWVLLWIVMLWILFSQILLLKYSWFTTLYQFLMDSKVIQLNINMFFFFSIFFPIIIYYKILNIGPCAIQQVLVVYFTYCRCLVTKSCLTLLWLHGLSSARPLCPLYFPGKNTGVGSHLLLQKIFLTQGSNSSLLNWQVGSLSLYHWEANI